MATAILAVVGHGLWAVVVLALGRWGAGGAWGGERVCRSARFGAGGCDGAAVVRARPGGWGWQAGRESEGRCRPAGPGGAARCVFAGWVGAGLKPAPTGSGSRLPCGRGWRSARASPPGA